MTDAQLNTINMIGFIQTPQNIRFLLNLVITIYIFVNLVIAIYIFVNLVITIYIFVNDHIVYIQQEMIGVTSSPIFPEFLKGYHDEKSISSYLMTHILY